MKGIYLSKEGKKEIEAKIAELEKPFMEWSKEDDAYEKYSNAQVYKEILSSATIIPVEQSWDYVDLVYIGVKKNSHPNGVIIQSKQ